MVNKRKEKQDKMKEEEALKGGDKKDPYFRYGFGLIAYRNTLWNLTMAFVVFTILALPICYTYRTGTAWKEGFSRNGKMTLGNLGYNSV